METIIRQISKIAIEISLSKTKEEIFNNLDKVLQLTNNKNEFKQFNYNLIEFKKKYECSRPSEDIIRGRD